MSLVGEVGAWNSGRRNRWVLKTLVHTPIEIDPIVNPKNKLARRIYLAFTHSADRVPTRKGATTELPSDPSSERTDPSGGNSVTRQRTLFGDSLNDEQ